MEDIMIRRAIVFAVALAFAVGFVFEAAGQASGKKLEKVTIQIEGSAVPYYMPIFAAIEKGWFAEEGLAVEYMFGNAADIAKNVAVGNVQFGFPNGEPIIVARSQDIPVMVVHSTLQHGLGATIFLKDSGIAKPADLKGKTIGITSLGSPNYVQLQVLLEKNKMSIKDVKIEVIGTEAIVPALVNKRVDAICFSMLRTFELKSQGIQVEEFRSDAFLPSFGNVLVTSKKYLDSSKNTVKAFVRALNKSLTWLSKPENVKAITPAVIEKHTPTYKGKEDYMADIVSSVYAGYLWSSDDVKKFGFGYGNAARWQETADIMRKFDTIKKPVRARDFVVADVLK
jgi:NitT/TauT family transport system substrate-binding protein